MAVEAPVSKFKKNNLLIFMVFALVVGAYCAYDGFFNESFIAEHTDAEGNPTSTLIFNQWAPFVAGPLAIIFAIQYLLIKDKKIVADDEKIDVEGKRQIPYENIEKIDKTHFQDKGYFVVTYAGPSGKSVDYKFNDRRYDKLGLLMDHIVAKIS